jgi:uncharacterized membrane protein YozB (DUF420 family)
MQGWAETNLLSKGFLGTAAPLHSDLALLLEIAMGVALLIGALLARVRKYRWHAWCQSAVVLLNLAVILLVMAPSFAVRVSPKIPAKLNKTFYALATAHAALGSIAEIAGLYLVFAAGTKILPQRFRVAEYKRWMRSVLVLWWFALLLGLATYIRWFTQ